MDLRTLTKLALKLAGIYMVLSALAAIPGIFGLPDPYDKANIFWFTTYFILGLALIWFPGGLINTVIRIPPAELEGTVTAVRLLQVGCILLGVYFALGAVYDIVYTYAKARWFYDAMKPFPNSSGPGLGPNEFASLTADAIQLALGVGLWIGSRYVVKAAGRFEDDR